MGNFLTLKFDFKVYFEGQRQSTPQYHNQGVFAPNFVIRSLLEQVTSYHVGKLVIDKHIHRHTDGHTNRCMQRQYLEAKSEHDY